MVSTLGVADRHQAPAVLTGVTVAVSIDHSDHLQRNVREIVARVVVAAYTMLDPPWHPGVHRYDSIYRGPPRKAWFGVASHWSCFIR